MRSVTDEGASTPYSLLPTPYSLLTTHYSLLTIPHSLIAKFAPAI